MEYKCEECGDCFSKKNLLLKHQRTQQHRRGAVKHPAEHQEETRPVKRRRLHKNDDPVEFYTIDTIYKRKIEKFNTIATHYKIRLKELEVTDLPTILKTLKEIFQSIIDNICIDIKLTDLVRVSVENERLDCPIVLPFMRRELLTVDRLLEEIEKLLQSYQQFVVDESFGIELTTVNLPSGSGHKRKPYVDISRRITEDRSFIKIKNKDELCCARALVTATARLEKHTQWNSIRQGRGIQQRMAEDLHKKAGVPLTTCGIEEVKRFQAVLPKYQIHVISKENFNEIIYVGTEGGKPIYLYFHDKHFDVITSMSGFYNRSYFCQQCRKGYNTKETHKCNNPCRDCRQLHDDTSDDKRYSCSDCNRHFKNETCFKLHQKKSSKGKSNCDKFFICRKCKTLINVSLHKKPHVCGEIYCKICNDFFAQGHLCYMQPVAKDTGKKKKGSGTYIFFDFECTQDDILQCESKYLSDESGLCKNCAKSWCGTFEHRPNLCVVHKVCGSCLNIPVTPTSSCKHCGKNEHKFQGIDTCKEFCQWLFSEENTGATTICHNFKAYDNYPIIQYLHDNAVKPEVIITGSKYMSINVPVCNIRMLDSLNFIPMPLADMPKSFGQTELVKGYFPHLFNRKENQDKSLTGLPDLKYYAPDSMKPENRDTFLKWYEQNKKNAFNFQEELLRYCRSDVDILRKCVLKFREIFIDLTKQGNTKGIDPFEKCITIASACHLVFRTNFLQPESIGIIPPHGYRPEDTQSVKAYQWLSYMEHKKGISIQHGKNKREKMINTYKVDGYYENNGNRFVLEFHGCFWHGCPKCFAKSTINPINGKSMEYLYNETTKKERLIKETGCKYDCIWECDFKRELEEKADMRIYIQSNEFIEPLKPRDAFFGGRTEGFKLYEEATETKKIKYLDVTSLYPFVNKTGKTPVGHPKITTKKFKDISKYEGLIKCKVLAPKGLYMPVLPIRCNGKLMFSLCFACSEAFQKDICQHSDTERSFVGTWVTDEVKEAKAQGYIIQKVYEVWHFDEISKYDPVVKTGGLFTKYINTFLKVKQEASGWPDWCETKEDKMKYIHEYQQKEGIPLDYSKIQKNPGMRSLAKLMLNSFWGKFGQKSNLTQTTYVSEPAQFFDMMTSDKQQMKNVRFINNEVVQLDWVYNDDFIGASSQTNVVIAAYTTAQARLELYNYLSKLGERVIYCDTDSIVFTASPGEWTPPVGYYLGDLKDEVQDNAITKFVTGGPKNYAYSLLRPNEDGHTSICKVRGITLNYKNLLDINFDTIKDMVTGESKTNKVTVVNANKIARNVATGSVITKRETKDYKIVFDKRVISVKDKYHTYPYGM